MAAHASDGSLVGRRVYSPGAIAAYSVLGGLPLGSLLYGLNVSRRGSRGMGTLLYVVGGGSYVFMLVAAAAGANIGLYGLLGIFGAIGFYKMESGPFQNALRRGAARARWWPPALIAVSANAVLTIAAMAFHFRLARP